MKRIVPDSRHGYAVRDARGYLAGYAPTLETARELRAKLDGRRIHITRGAGLVTYCGRLLAESFRPAEPDPMTCAACVWNYQAALARGHVRKGR